MRTGLRQQLSDVATLTFRNLLHIRREPLRLSDATVQPVLFTLLFVYVFGAAAQIPGGSYKQFAIAGLLAMNLTTSAMGTAVGLCNDLGSGIIDRFRTLPLWRASILIGRTLADLLTAALCASFVIGTGLLVGWRPEGSIPAALAAVGLFLAFSYALSWACVVLAIFSRDAESAQGTGLIVLFPLAIVSNALVPTAHMPGVLRTIADWNPVSALTCEARKLLHNPNPSASIHSWPMEHPLAASLAWIALLLAVFGPLAVALYKRRTER
ncbi:MAG TPA: ABC transporter permease [Solirubrobacteraceae bacterium]|nr:ABC transporter permease [Solirubrobacteraceae bacterium]